jgi:hypothetical protein
MSSVPELRESHRAPDGTPLPGGRPRSGQRLASPNPWDVNNRALLDDPQSGNRLVHQKSMERGMVAAASRPSPQGKRIPSGGGRPGGRPESRPGSRSGPHVHPGSQNRAPPPGLKMPLAFNNIAVRDRGLSNSGPQPPPPHARSPHKVLSSGVNPTTSAPDLFENQPYPNRRPQHWDPPRSHPYPQPPYSTPVSVNNSPHSSLFGPSHGDEVRASFRSALSGSEPNRSSGFTSFTSSSETQTDDSYAMTVDEAIGMYGSDSDDYDMYTSGVESEHRRSKGDSVLGGVVSRQGSYEDGEGVAKDDGGDTSPQEHSRSSAQDGQLEEEIERQSLQGKSAVSPALQSGFAQENSKRASVEAAHDAEAQLSASVELKTSDLPNGVAVGEPSEFVGEAITSDGPEQEQEVFAEAMSAQAPKEPRDRYG